MNIIPGLRRVMGKGATPSLLSRSLWNSSHPLRSRFAEVGRVTGSPVGGQVSRSRVGVSGIPSMNINFRRWMSDNDHKDASQANETIKKLEEMKVEYRRREEESNLFSWKALLVLGLTGCGMYAFSVYYKDKRMREEAATVKSVGKPAIGGHFSLVDGYGRPITDSNFRGRFMLVYFGFTFCPDICPVELQKMSRAIDKLDEDPDLGLLVQPLFISVDPWRDSVGATRKYCDEFHPRLLGLTGTPDQVAECCKAYRVYSSKGPSEEEDEEDYLVDHTVFMYLMDPRGELVAYFGQNKTEEEIAESIEKHVREEYGLTKKWWQTLF